MKRRSPDMGVIEALPERVATFLMRQVEAGELPPGQRLPTEQQIADRFGVSRNVVREAVARLRADGVVEARQGVGAFVLAPEQRAAFRIDTEALLDGRNMQDLFDLRCIIETESAREAASRCDAAALAGIRASLERMQGEERWQDGSIDADLAFHRGIAQATGNSYIFSIVTFICGQIGQSIRYARQTNPLHDMIDINVGEHVRIYDALAAADPHAAAAAMRAHIVAAAARVGVAVGARNAAPVPGE